MSEPLRGPAFSSYPPSDVAWLLTDVSGRVPQSSGVAREQSLQSGAHYAESLPIEYAPQQAYVDLVKAAMVQGASQVAQAVAAVGEQVMNARGGAPVLVSLARAGTPAGILLRRWLAFHYGVDAPHYTMSIILDRGLDAEALSYLTRRHDPRSIVFVDGWTGKGTISGELSSSLAALGDLANGVSPELAVLTDPAGSSAFAGTDEDILIPTAMLNSTVSGLVSRTVYSRALIPVGSFHGAQFASELAGDDLSTFAIDAVVERFGEVRGANAPRRDPAARRRVVLAELERLSHLHAVSRPGLIKAGVCETTRVLLRRVPRAVVVGSPGHPDLAHIEHLAAERGVPVIHDPQLAFAAVGLIAQFGSEA
jgi:hypothetical protein